MLAGWRYAREKWMMPSFTVCVARVTPAPRTSLARHPSPPMHLQLPGTWPQFFRHVRASPCHCSTTATLHRQAPGAPPTLLRQSRAWIRATLISQPYRQVENCCRPWLGWGRKPARWRPAAHSHARHMHAVLPEYEVGQASLGAPHCTRGSPSSACLYLHTLVGSLELRVCCPPSTRSISFRLAPPSSGRRDIMTVW